MGDPDGGATFIRRGGVGGSVLYAALSFPTPYSAHLREQ